MEIMVNKETYDVAEAAQTSFEAVELRALRSLAVLIAAKKGSLQEVELKKVGKNGSFHLVDPTGEVVLRLPGTLGLPKKKGLIRGAVVNQRVEQAWAVSVVPQQALKAISAGFQLALSLAVASGKGTQEKPSQTSPKAENGNGKKGNGKLPTGRAVPKPKRTRKPKTGARPGRSG